MTTHRRAAAGHDARTNAVVAVHSLLDRHVGVLVAGGRVLQAVGVVGVLRLLLIRRNQIVLASGLLGVEVAAAVEVGGIVRAARAVVEGGLRPRAQGTRAAAAGREDAVGGDALLDPAHHGVEHALRLRAVAAAA